MKVTTQVFSGAGSANMKYTRPIILLCIAMVCFPVRGAEIAGHLDWPETWTVFAPAAREDPVPAADTLRAVPTALRLGDRILEPRAVTPSDCAFDFAPLFGGAEVGKTAYAFLTFTAPADAQATLGMGADWWMQVWLDGTIICDTEPGGNGAWPPRISNHTRTLDLAAGPHILAVRFVSGSGSSVLALGGPDQLRDPKLLWERAAAKAPGMTGVERVPNGRFESGGNGSPWIPTDWTNGTGADGFASNELHAGDHDQLAPGTCLEIDTRGQDVRPRRLFTRLNVAPGTLYRIAYKGVHLDGAPVSISLRRTPDSACTYFLGGGTVKPGWRGDCSGYYLIENPRPYLVIECREPAHLFLDDLSILACADESKRWASYGQQRFPWDSTWISLTNKVVTPHVPWAHPLAGGPVRLVTLLPRWRQRWTVEMAQRLDATYEPVMFADPHQIGAPFWVQGAGGAPALFDPKADAFEKLHAPSDCLIVGYVSPSAFPPSMVETILERVAAGAGLVIVGYGQPFYPYPDGRLPECMEKFKAGPWARGLCATNATDEDTDYVRLGPVSSAVDEFYRYGKGRIAYLRTAEVDGGAYELPTHPARSPANAGCRRQFEHQLAYIAKAVLWAAGRVPDTRIASLRLPGVDGEPALTARVDFKALPAPLGVRIERSRDLTPEAALAVWGVDTFGIEQFRIDQTLKTPTNTVTVPLPRLKGGKHFVYAQLLDKGVVRDWTAMLLDIVPPLPPPTIAMPSNAIPYAIAGPELCVVVSPPDQVPDGIVAYVRLTDIAGRVWHTDAWPAATGPRTVVLPTTQTVTLVHRLRAGLRDPDGDLVETEQEFTIAPEPATYRASQDFQIWQLFGADYLMELLSKTMHREYGLTSVLYPGNPSLLNVRCNAWNNMRSLLALTGVPGSQNKVIGDPQHAPVRDICLSSPQTEATVLSRVNLFVPPAAPYAPLAYTTDHEQNLRGATSLLPPKADVCFSPTCLVDLRRFLEAEYADLDALNETWGTDFTSWEDVQPITLMDAMANGQVARWVDHRRHMDRLWTDFTARRVAAVRRYDPHAEGISDNVRSGKTVNDSFNGIDHWLLMNEVTAGAASPASYLAAFVPAERRHLVWQRNAAWHPDVWTAEPDLLRARFARGPWQALFEGASGYTYWASTWLADPHKGNFETPLTADLRPTALGRMAADASARVRSGIDRFVMQGQRDDSGIGLYYSRPSEHVCTAWQAMHARDAETATSIDPRASQFSFFAAALRRAGRAFRSVAYGQVSADPDALSGLKLLILPYVQAMAPDEVAALRAFVRDGGWILADIRPAVCDQHGRCLPAAGLDEVFGVRHATALDAYVPQRGDVILNGRIGAEILSGTIRDALIGPAVEIVTAKAQGKGGAAPILLVHPYGKGRAVLLNFACLPAAADTAALDDALAGIFAACGAPPLLGVDVINAHWFTGDGDTTPVTGAKETGSDDMQRLVASENGGEVEGISFGGVAASTPTRALVRNGDIDCFAFWYGKGRGHGTQRVRVTPPQPGVVYDLRSGNSLGHVADTFEFTMPLEGLAAFAVCPTPIPTPVLTITPGADEQGRRMIGCDAHLAGEDFTRRHMVVQFMLFAPDGHEWTDFRVSATTLDGHATHRFVLPHNAPAGTWRVTAREALSGLSDAEDAS